VRLRRSDKWILDSNGDAIAFIGDFLVWAEWFEHADRQLARDEIGGCVVSTVFLGIDHGFGRNREPVLWETMVFEGTEWSTLMRREFPRERYTRRHTSRAEALAFHALVVDAIKKGTWE
jgi:hypothetical protein